MPPKPTVAPKKPRPAQPKDANLIVRIPAALRDKFAKWCTKNDSTMSGFVRGMIERTV